MTPGRPGDPDEGLTAADGGFGPRPYPRRVPPVLGVAGIRSWQACRSLAARPTD